MHKYDSEDIESQMQLTEQCSANFYKSCLDYRRKRLAPLGLLWLGSPLFLVVVVTNSSFCFLRPSDKIENNIFSSKNPKNETKLNNLLNVLISVYMFNSSDPIISLFLNGCNVLDTIRVLIKMLHADPKTDGDMEDTLHSRLFTFMELNSKNYGQSREYVVDASNLAYSYWIQALFSHDIKLYEKMISSNVLLAREPFMDYIYSLLNYTWPLIDASTLVEFLLQEGQYTFIQQIAQLLSFNKWEETLIISYLLNNDPDKALKKDQDRKLNCLHTFVLTLLENNEKEKLLSFNFYGLQSSVEDIVLKKARSLSNVDAYPFYMFLCSIHDKYAKYKKLSMTFYELYLRADTCVAQAQYLRLSLLYLEILNPNDAWFTDDVHDGIIQIEHLKKFCWLARACQEIEESTTNTDVQSVISILLMKHKYKDVMHLSKMWNLSLYQPLRELVKTCISLIDSEERDKAWIWLADNGVSGEGIDSEKIAWHFLEKLVNTYEKEGKTLIHYHVADELLRHKSFLPNWIVKTFKERNVGELLQLYLSYGELINCSDLILELIEKEISSDDTESKFDKTIPVDIIECVIVNLKHNNLQTRDEVLNKYKIFYDKIVAQENKIKCF
ncbi:nuclear pore complex protein Nup160-like [Aphis craccivora]|uniref:Nuclear pore complex protein Nup160-like n=1 Tax=Aphis craccivora TaxID=307492 RepID=A0A6G0XDY0_APHCR|nr:nuclear pore complex protein Nup160-like [Aphis craccivora]